MYIVIAVKNRQILEGLKKGEKSSPHSCVFVNPGYKGLLSAFYDAGLAGVRDILFMTDADFDSELSNSAEEIAAQFGIRITKSDCRDGARDLYHDHG